LSRAAWRILYQRDREIIALVRPDPAAMDAEAKIRSSANDLRELIQIKAVDDWIAT
jgi:hypothetical protein